MRAGSGDVQLAGSRARVVPRRMLLSSFWSLVAAMGSPSVRSIRRRRTSRSHPEGCRDLAHLASARSICSTESTRRAPWRSAPSLCLPQVILVAPGMFTSSLLPLPSLPWFIPLPVRHHPEDSAAARKFYLVRMVRSLRCPLYTPSPTGSSRNGVFSRSRCEEAGR